MADYNALDYSSPYASPSYRAAQSNSFSDAYRAIDAQRAAAAPFQTPYTQQTAHGGTIQDPGAWGPYIQNYQGDIQGAVDRLKVSNSDQDFAAYQRGITNFWNAAVHGEYYMTPGGVANAEVGGLDPRLRNALQTGSQVPDDYGVLLDYPAFWFANHDPGGSTKGGKYYSVPAGTDPSTVLPVHDLLAARPMYDISTGLPYAANNIGGYTTPGYGSYPLYGQNALTQ